MLFVFILQQVQMYCLFLMKKKNEEWHGNGIKIVRKREASEKVKL
jgi:hypothetical protein